MWTKDKVLELRRALGLTQKEFAEILGCRQQTVSEWEVGLYVPANAYGKLLEQISLQSRQSRPLASRAAPVASSSPIGKGAAIIANDAETDLQFDKPFDPAID
jgi:DNA-binding XRE family transcriptional regulator